MIWTLLYLILVHWVADFVLQSRKMGENKSHDNFWLTVHVTVYSFATIVLWVVFFLSTGTPMSPFSIWKSFIVIYATHWITDYTTSKITSKYANDKRWYGFFTTIGFDQVLHYTHLFITYNYLILH